MTKTKVVRLSLWQRSRFLCFFLGCTITALSITLQWDTKVIPVLDVPNGGKRVMKAKKTPRQLAEEHWIWLEPLLTFPVPPGQAKHLYVTAMVHGIKHGKDKDTIEYIGSGPIKIDFRYKK